MLTEGASHIGSWSAGGRWQKLLAERAESFTTLGQAAAFGRALIHPRRFLLFSRFQAFGQAERCSALRRSSRSTSLPATSAVETPSVPACARSQLAETTASWNSPSTSWRYSAAPASFS